MYKLRREHYDRVRPLVELLDIHLALRAIVEGDVDAEIYVDDIRAPHVAFTRTQHRFYLVGTPDNATFNAALRDHLLHDVYPEALAADDIMFTLYYAPEAWGTTAPDVLRGKDPIPDTRHYYEFQGRDRAWRHLLPEGFTVRPVDADLLNASSLANLDALREELCSERPSVEAFLEKSFGVCVQHEDALVGWCLSEYNCGERCEVGIATLSDHRRRGLATAMTAALIEEAHARGITRVGWHCWASNAGSIATALKAGFERVAVYPVFFGYFDTALNLAVNGNMQFGEENYAEALTWFQRAFDQGVTQTWIYWRAACTAARLTRREIALRYLNEAVAAGFDDVERLRTSPHLITLHQEAGWSALLRQLGEAPD
jgi:GNAT superfamily N-acetyltransferase